MVGKQKKDWIDFGKKKWALVGRKAVVRKDKKEAASKREAIQVLAALIAAKKMMKQMKQEVYFVVVEVASQASLY